jgi:Domain of unknown function (DUF3472)/Malectin domain
MHAKSLLNKCAATAALSLMVPIAQANYWGYNNIVQNQTYQLEFTPRISQNNTYWATMSVSSIGGYGGIQQHGAPGDNWGLFSLWDSSDTVIDSFVAGLNPFITFGGSPDHRFGGEGAGSQLSFVLNWQLNKPYRMAWRRFIVPGGNKVRYSTFYYDPYAAGGWVWVGMFEKPQSNPDAQNMNGFEGFSEDYGGTGGVREIDIRNVWLLDLNNSWRNIGHANNTDNRDNGQLWPIAGGWRHHSYDPTYPFQPSDDVAMGADATLAPMHLPYLVNCGANIQPSIVANDQVGSHLGRSFEPDAYWNGTSTTGSTAAAIDVTGVDHAAPARLYQTWREGANFGYTFFGLKPNLPTRVRVHFAEPSYDTAGARRQSVVINGATVDADLDIRALAGAKNKPVVKIYWITPGADGRINLSLNSLVADVPAIVSGIEVGRIARGVPLADAAIANTTRSK